MQIPFIHFELKLPTFGIFKSCLHLFLAVSFFFPSKAQQDKSFLLSKKSFTTEEGLSHRHINQVIPSDSSKGFIALTADAVSIFDGKSISQFPYEQTFSNLGYNYGVSDKNKLLWLAETFHWFDQYDVQHVSIFDLNEQKFKKLTSFETEGFELNALDIYSFSADKSGNLFVSTRRGEVFSIDLKQKKKRLIYQSSSKAPLKLISVGDNYIYLSKTTEPLHDTALLIISRTGKLISEKKIPIERSSTNYLKSIHEVNGKPVFSYKGNMLRLIDTDIKTVHKFNTSTSSYLRNTIYLPKQKLWALAVNNQISLVSDAFETVFKQTFPFQIHQVSVDKSGNIFLATNQGIHILRVKPRLIKNFLFNASDKNEGDQKMYSHRKIQQINDSTVVTLTNQGRYKVNLNTGKFSEIGQRMYSGGIVAFYLSCYYDKAKRQLYFGENRIVKHDFAKNKDEIIYQSPETKIWAIYPYQDKFFLGLEKMGFKVIHQDGTSSNWLDGIELPSELLKATVYAFAQLNDSEFLIGSTAGLYVLSGRNISPLSSSIDSTPKFVFFIEHDKYNPNELLIAASNGLFVMDRTSKSVRVFNKEVQGIKFLSFYTIDNGYIASTEQGVYVFASDGQLQRILTEQDGLTDNECNRKAHFQGEDGKVFFGGIDGLNVIETKQLRTKKNNNPELYLRTLNAVNVQGEMRQVNISSKGKVTLNYDDASLQINAELLQLSYDCPEVYRYRIVSEEDTTLTWTESKNSDLTVSQFPEGISTLEIECISCNNYANSGKITLTVKRNLPFYKSLWFWLLFVVAVALISTLIFWIYSYSLRQQNIRLSKVVDKQTKALRKDLDLKNDLLTLLTHDIRVPIYQFTDISKRLNFLIEKKRYELLDEFGVSIEEKSKTTLWVVDALVLWIKQNKQQSGTERYKSISVLSTIAKIEDLFKSEIEKKNLTITSNLTSETKVTTERELLIISLRNLLYNAVSYSPVDTIIHIDVKVGSNQLIFEVRNTTNEVLDNKLPVNLGIAIELLGKLLSKARGSLKTIRENNEFVATLTIPLQIP